MSDPNPEEAQLTNLSDDYIRELEPEIQRYDITLSQDFVISVLPNGIKTWAFIYDFQGRHRRKTLGVFPEMNFDAAKVALEKARASMLRMDEPTVAPNEFGQLPAVLGGSKYSPKRTKQPFNYRFWFKLLGVLLAIALAAFGGMKALEWRDQRAAEQVSEPERAPLPFAISKKPAAKTPPADSNPDTSDSTLTPESTRTTRPAPPQQNSQSSSSASNSTPAATTAGRSSPTQTSQSPTSRAQPDGAQASPPSSAPQTTRQNVAPATTRPQSTSSTPPRSVSAGTTPPVTALTTTSKATAFGGRVARSQLTSKVQDLEPTDVLGPEISYKNSGYTRVFYFTELREFGEGNVVHRWSLDGEVHEEVVLKVKKSWRWRTYSNKDITPGLNGEWKVETIDATGKILDFLTFTYDYQ